MTIRLCILLLALTTVNSAKKAEVVNLAGLQKIIDTRDGTVKVINFWATWCGPCVEELPLFEKLNHGRKDVTVLLVSMDLDLNPDTEKVERFISGRKLKCRVLLMDEKDPGGWIPRIDPQWSGSLPATLIINPVTGKRSFTERKLHEGELEKLIADLK